MHSPTYMLGKPLKILSINANTSQEVTEDFLQQGVEQQFDIIVVQEPWWFGKNSNPPRDDFTNFTSTSHQSFMQISPNHPINLRPRTLTYVSKSCELNVNLSQESPLDTDIQILSVSDGQTTIQLINLYNQLSLEGGNTNTFQRHLANLIPHSNSIIIGDFNAHHPMWEPHAVSSSQADEELAQWTEEFDLNLQNTPGIVTWSRPRNGGISESTIDLAFTSPSVSNTCEYFNVNPDICSDHYSLQLHLKAITNDDVVNPTTQTRYNTNLADWNQFEKTLKANVATSRVLSNPTFGPGLVTTENSKAILEETNQTLINLLDRTANAFTKAINDAADASIPKVKPNAKAKAWWNPELRELRHSKTNLRRNITPEDRDSIFRYCEANKKYLQAITAAKRGHWNQFLQKEDSKSIFRAMKYTKNNLVSRIPLIKNLQNIPQSTFDGKCDAFRSTLFPPPPVAEKPNWDDYQPNHNKWEWPKLTRQELYNVCSNGIKSKSPGPDGINQEIITKAFQALPDLFFRIYSVFIDLGYHPKCWKTATGAILPKPNKPDYSIPKAYRIITELPRQRFRKNHS